MAATGGGGTPISILFKIEGVEQAKQLIASLTPEFQKVQAEADKTGKSVGDAAKGFKDLGDSGKEVENVSDSLEKVDKSGTNLTKTTGNIKKGFDTAKTSATGVSSEVNKASQSFDKHKTSTEGTLGAYQRYNSEGQKVKTSNDGISTSMDKVGSSSKTSTQSFNAVAVAVGDVTVQSDKSKGSVDALGNAHSNLTGSVDKAKGGLDAHSNTLVKVDQSTTKTATSTEQLGSRFMTQVGSVSALGGSITSLWETYDSLGDAQLKVDKATNTLHATQLKIQTLQEKLNKLTLEGKEGTTEYQLAEDKLQLAQDKLQATQGTLDNAQEDLNTTTANFYREILPQTVTLVGSLTATLASSKTEIVNFIGKIKEMGGATGALSKVLSMISLTNPFFLALTVGGALVGAFVTNLFGFRDAINSVGEAIGNAIGPLKPFLTMIGQLGQGVVDALGQGGDATEAYAQTTDESMDSVGTALDGAGQKTQGYVSLLSQEIKSADGTVVGFTNAYGTNMATNVKSTEGFGTAMKTMSQTAETEFQKTLSEAQTAAGELARLFDKTQSLNGLALGGLPGDNTQFKLAPKSNLGKDIGAGRAPSEEALKPQLSDKAKSALSGIETQVNPETNKLYYNQKKLEDAFKSGDLTMDQYMKTMSYLGNVMHGVGIRQDTNISGAEELRKKSEQAAKANAQEGVSFLDLSTLTDDYNKRQQQRLGILKDGTKATKEGTDTQKAYGISMDELADSGDNAADTTKKNTEATKQLTAGQKFMQDTNDDTKKTWQTYNDILNDNVLLTDVQEEGTLRQQAAMAKSAVETLGNAAASAKYTKQLDSSAGATYEVAKGVVTQNDALNQAKAQMYQNIGALGVLSDTTKMADAQNVAMVDGYVKTELAMKNTQIATKGTWGEVKALHDEYASGEGRITAYNKGEADQAKAFELQKVAVDESRGKLSEMHKEYASGEASLVAYNQAYVDQGIAFENDKLKADQLKGTIKALNEQGASGEADVVAYNNAYQEQELAFTKSKTAASALQGTIADMQDNFDVARVIAFNQGYEEQRLKIEQDKLAIDNLHGTLRALIEDYDLADGSTRAFNKGVAESEIAFQNARSAVDSLEGSIAVLIEHLNDGTQQVLSYNQGMLDTRQSVLQAVAGVSQLSGSVREFGTAVEAGLPQATAFQTAVLNQRKAMDDMKVATAGTLGTIKEMLTQLNNAGDQVTRFNSGFANGYKDILTWAENINTAQGAAAGMQQALDKVAGTLKENIPDSYALSIDKQKEWIAVMAGAPQETQAIFDEIVGQGESFAKTLSQAMEQGGKEGKDAMKKIGKELGFTLTDEMKQGMQPSLIAAGLRDQLKAGLSALNLEQIGSEGFQQVADGMIGGINDAIAKSPELANVGQDIILTIQKLKLNPSDMTLWDQLKQKIDEFKPSGSAAFEVTKQFQGELRKRDGYDTQIQGIQDVQTALANYQKAIEATQRSIDTYKQNTGGNMFANTTTGGLGDWDKPVGGALGGEGMSHPMGGGQGPQMDFSSQMTQIDALKTKLAEIPQAVSTMVQQANANLATFMQPLAQVTGPALVAVEQMLLKMPTDVTTMVTNSNANLGIFLQPLAQVTGPALVAVEQMLLTLPTDVTTMVTQSNTNLATFMQPLAQITGPALVLIEQMLLKLPTDVSTMVTTSNTNLTPLFEPLATTIFPKMQTDAANAFAAVSNIAGTESKKIAPFYTTAAGAIDQALKKSQNTSATTFQAISNIAQSESKKVGPFYDQAAKAIDTALKKSQTDAANTFQAITNIAKTESTKIGPLFDKASQAVVKALGEMEKKAQSVFQSISKSADQAKSSVDKLKSSIDALKDKTVTITTRYVTSGSPGYATGFGPTIVDHPMNMTVGEAGPEYVSVIPLSSASSKNLSPEQRLQKFADPGKKRKNPLQRELTMADASPYANYRANPTGRVPMAQGSVFSSSNISVNSSAISDTQVINQSVLSMFSNSINRISSSIDRQNSIMQSSSGDTRNIYGGTNVYGDSGFSLPRLMQGGSSNGPRYSGATGGGGLDGLIAGIKDAVLAAFSRTSINLTSTTILDSEKINENQNKLFGIRNGAVLK